MRISLSLPACAALLIGGIAVGLRLWLIALGMPRFDSDEGTMGLMALHILRHGAHPLFFYGQAYMGSLEAYLAAGLFALFGASDLTLRLGLIVIFALFLAAMYALVRTLYGQGMALFSLAVLTLGSGEILARELKAVGGYPEMLLFSTVMFLLAARLAITAEPASGAHPHRRWLAFGAWGLAAGLGVWSSPFTLPFVVLAFLLFLLTTRRELIGLSGCCLVLGLLIGLSPAIAYNATASAGQDTLSSLLRIGGAGGSGHVISGSATIDRRIAGLVAVSIPVITGGNGLCRLQPQDAWPLSPHSSSHTVTCTAVHAAWGVGFIALWVWALLGAIMGLIAVQRSSLLRESTAARRQRARQLGRLLLLASAGVTVGLFLLTPAPAHAPWFNVRYLAGVWVAMPAILAPAVATLFNRRSGVIRAAVAIPLVVVGAALLLETVNAFGDGGYTSWLYQQQRALAADLHSHHVRHIYTDYWTCDWLAFETHEGITCAVLDEQLRPSLDRYPAYRSAVRRDPRAWYVFRLGTPQVTAFDHRRASAYRRTAFPYYVVYPPK